MAEKNAPGELELIRRFVNTHDVEDEVDAIGTPDGLAAWLREHGLADAGLTCSEGDVRMAGEIREALRDLLLANNGAPLAPEAPAVLDSAAREAELTVRFEADGSSRLEPAGRGATAALGRLLAIAYRSMAEGTWRRLKACGDDTCQWAFYDHSKNRSGHWCTMEVCGNRAKARAYRRRQASGASSGA